VVRHHTPRPVSPGQASGPPRVFAAPVVVLKLDRLFRSTADGARWLDEWTRRGVGLHVLDMRGEALDTRSASGRFHLDIMISVGQWERCAVVERTALTLDDLRRRRRAYGSTPLSFDRGGTDGGDLVPNAAKAALVQRIGAMHRDGMAYSAVSTARPSGRRDARTDRMCNRYRSRSQTRLDSG
jgi:DNA invertase Pin-like site-specific DNA recombinase